MFAGLALVVIDLLRLWHQTYAFYGGYEPLTFDLARSIANGTLWGAGWKLQTISAALAGAAFAGAYRGWPAAWHLAALAAAVTTASRPLTGHALEQATWVSLPVILQAAHVLAAAVWVGALTVIVIFGVRRARLLPPGDGARVTAEMIERFSPVALGAAAVLFFAGTGTSFLYLGSLRAALSGAYGVALMAKVATFGVVAGIGCYNWQRVRPRLTAAVQGAGDDPGAQQLLLRAAAAELTAAGLVLAVTAVLVALPLPPA